jgi:hypothetical protein
MKQTITLFLYLLSFSVYSQKKQKIVTQSQPIIPTEIKPAMKAEDWSITGKAEFLTYKGIPALKIESVNDTDQVVLRNVIFENGTIEYDIEAYSSSSIYFRRNGYREQEIFYLRKRFNQPLNNDCIQYCPVIDGVNMWDVFDQFQAPALIKPKEWNHIKLVISGFQMRVYVNDMSKPTLEIPRLEGSQKTGSIAFDGNCVISNIVIKPNQTEGLATYEGTDLTNHDANYLRKWLISKPIALPNGTEPYFKNLPESNIFELKIEAERYGLINLTRQFGENKQREMVWLKIKFNSETAQQKLLSLGFSEEIWVFVNQKNSYTDKNLYRLTNVRKYPDGRLSIQNTTIPIQLQKGENEILIAVANDFYGWGLVARLLDLEGITF